METINYTVFLANYLRDTLSTFSDSELRLTIFLFEVLINKDEEEFLVLLDDFINGWTEEQGNQIVEIISATGLNEEEILMGLEEVADRGLFTYKPINFVGENSIKSFAFKSNVSIAIKHNINNSNFYNFPYESFNNTDKKA